MKPNNNNKKKVNDMTLQQTNQACNGKHTHTQETLEFKHEHEKIKIRSSSIFVFLMKPCIYYWYVTESTMMMINSEYYLK